MTSTMPFRNFFEYKQVLLFVAIDEKGFIVPEGKAVKILQFIREGSKTGYLNPDDSDIPFGSKNP